jgi:hypothetical protein
MTRLFAFAATGLVLAGLAATPAAAQPWYGGYDAPRHRHWDGPRWHGPHYDGPRWQGPRWGAYDGYRVHRGPRCRTVMITRWSHRLGTYVQRPVEMCG